MTSAKERTQAEIAHLISYAEQELQKRELHGSSGKWHCLDGVESSCCSKFVYASVEKHFRDQGFEVRREKRYPGAAQSRVRGFWIRKRVD